MVSFRQSSSGAFFNRFIVTVKKKIWGKEVNQTVVKREVPKGYELRTSEVFIRRQRAAMRVRAKKLNELGIKGTKAAEVKRLYRIRKAASMLAEDSHISACTKETAFLLAKYLKQEFYLINSPRVNRVLLGMTNSDSKNIISIFSSRAEDLESRALSKNPEVDSRFVGKDKHPFTEDVENIIRDAEYALRGKATGQSPIIPGDFILFHFAFSLADARLKSTLGENNYKILKQAVAQEREGLRH